MQEKAYISSSTKRGQENNTNNIESTWKIGLVSTSEVKAGKEQIDHEVNLEQKVENNRAGEEIYITNNQGSSSS